MILLAVDTSQIRSTINQNPLLKDFAIAAAIVVVLIIIQIPLSIRRRAKRHELRKKIEHDRAQPGGTDPIDGMAELAASRGLDGPDHRPASSTTRSPSTRHEMLRNLWGYPRGIEQEDLHLDSNNYYTNVYSRHRRRPPVHGGQRAAQRRPVRQARPRAPRRPVGLGVRHEDAHRVASALRQPARQGRLPGPLPEALRLRERAVQPDVQRRVGQSQAGHPTSSPRRSWSCCSPATTGPSRTRWAR